MALEEKKRNQSNRGRGRAPRRGRRQGPGEATSPGTDQPTGPSTPDTSSVANSNGAPIQVDLAHVSGVSPTPAVESAVSRFTARERPQGRPRVMRGARSKQKSSGKREEGLSRLPESLTSKKASAHPRDHGADFELVSEEVTDERIQKVATTPPPPSRRPRGSRGRRRPSPGETEVRTAEQTTEQESEGIVEHAPSRPLPKRRTRRNSERVEIVDEYPEGEPLPEEIQPDEGDSPQVDGVQREMLINVSGEDECRIAVLQGGRLEELFIERAEAQSLIGNIYKGRITNVEPSVQAVFVDFGLPKNGFLHISDVQPQYFPDHKGEPEQVGRKIPRHNRPPIQKCFRRGQEVIVQITREGIGTKGPSLTTYLSIPGQFLVMMPGMGQHGVSRKIEDEDARREMRDLMKELKTPPGMGFILRTAGLNRNKRDLQRDLSYLLRLWKNVAERVKTTSSPAEVYRESDLVTRTIRDVYTADFSKIIVDDEVTAEKTREFLHLAMPRGKTEIQLHNDREPLFHRFGIEQEIENISSRHVPLASGGSLVIESTEALVAIDVNSGRYRMQENPEETAYRINMEAAVEIARQLRLRDLGGLIVCDFIDMRADRHKRAVEKALRDALKHHKERAKLLRMSAFGIIEMTRQRQGRSIKKNLYSDCPQCKGTGQVKLVQSVILDVLRLIQLAAHKEEVRKVTVTVAADIASALLNGKRIVLAQTEAETGKAIVVHGDLTYTSDQVECLCEDARGQTVPLALSEQPTKSSRSSK